MYQSDVCACQSEVVCDNQMFVCVNQMQPVWLKPKRAVCVSARVARAQWGYMCASQSGWSPVGAICVLARVLEPIGAMCVSAREWLVPRGGMYVSAGVAGVQQ